MSISLRGLLIAALLLFVSRAAVAETDAERLIARAKLGSTDAQGLGLNYRAQNGYFFADNSKLEQNFDEAEYWLKEAAAKGLQGKLYLSGLYASYDFPRRNFREAASLMIDVVSNPKASKEQIASASAGLGDIYYQECTGHLISLDCSQDATSPPKDYKAAARWYKIAVEGLDDYYSLPVKFNLAAMYEKGQGVPQDYQEAIKLYQELHEKHHEQAAFMLGDLYERMRQFPKAYMWFNLAATENLYEAAERRDRLAKSMGQDQLLEGQRLTREYLAAHKGQ
jgi:TPR repeat protein